MTDTHDAIVAQMRSRLVMRSMISNAEWSAVADRIEALGDGAVLDEAWLRRLEALLVNAHTSLPDNLIVEGAIAMVNDAFNAMAKSREPDPDDMEHDFSNAVRGAVLKKTEATMEATSVSRQHLDKLVADRMAPIYEAFAAALEVGETPQPDSLAMQYLDKLVADQMAPIYAAFAAAPEACDPVNGETRKDFIRAINNELWERGLGGVEPAGPTHSNGDAS